ncbi:MAG: dihydroorotate dehydrogenase electron transfer subunit [Candidatus Brocadia sp. WS118]|nr:MAG: dihydroorotate dehydrogenase electron transfer subunit [Candidatus Brocadia sp. WS118]
MIEQPTMVKICDILEESPGVKTFFFKGNLQFVPGQFVMVWIPTLDEKPFTISYIQKDIVGISVLKRGEFTQALHKKRVGDLIGIRGPYGRGFDFQSGSNPCIVGGGIGMASLATVVDRLRDATIIQGARTASEIIYQKRFPEMKLCTDDGSIGFKGTTIDLLKELLKTQTFDKVYTCGPERMMYKVVELCKNHGIDCEVSLDRYMKCGFGVCGQCDCSGQRVCIDGPVFTTAELSTMEDFGRIHILKTGERVNIHSS